MRSFTDGMNDLLRPPIPPRTDSKKVVSKSILSINAILPNEKVVFSGIKFSKHYLLILLLAKSGLNSEFCMTILERPGPILIQWCFLRGEKERVSYYFYHQSCD